MATNRAVSGGAHGPILAWTGGRRRERTIAAVGPSDLLPAIARVLPPARIVTAAAGLAAFESDGLTTFRARPRAVVLPETRRRSRGHRPALRRGRGAVRGPRQRHQPVGRRGAARGRHRHRAQPPEPRILEIDPIDRVAVVEPGVINLDVSAAAIPLGLYYAPDPSSQAICTIGGNIAFNSGGAHCFRHGMTLNHVLGLKAVLADGEAGDARRRQPGAGRARPRRRLRRLRGPLRDRARNHAAAAAAAGRLPHRARRLPLARGRGRRRVAHRPLRAAARAPWRSWTTWPSRRRRPPSTPAIRLDAAAVLLVELEGEAADIDAAVRRPRGADPRLRRLQVRIAQRRGGAAGDVEGPQVGVLGGRPPQPRLHRPGRRRAAQPARRGAGRHRGDRRASTASASPTSSTPATATCTR